MANKRMFTKKITDSDPFLDMPLSTQALYFHLNMNADDDGFVNNPKKIQRSVGASEDDLKLLLVKRFILGFENGVIVIKHWRMHNLLRKDRYNPTQYQEQLSGLELKDNGSYTEKLPELPMESGWQPNGNQMATQYSIDKNSIDKSSIDNIVDANAPPSVSKKDISDFFESVWLLYPCKKGKGQVSDSKKKTLYGIGYEEIARAIERYKDDLSKEDWRKPQNGSTFFNSGYVDYLDANYVPLEVKPQQHGKNKFNNFPQRQVNKAESMAMERMLLKQQSKPVYAGDNPEVKEKMEKLKEELQGR